jgi:hypothetical protein
VGVLVLLKKSLYVGNKFWMYFVDLIAVSLVSWRAIMAGGRSLWVMSSCMLGSAVSKEATFQVMMWFGC